MEGARDFDLDGLGFVGLSLGDRGPGRLARLAALVCSLYPRYLSSYLIAVLHERVNLYI